MSRPRQAVLEGEDSGPSYGAVNGVPSPTPPRATEEMRTDRVDAPSSSGVPPKQSASVSVVPIAPPTGQGACDAPSSSGGVVPKNAHHTQVQRAQQTPAAASQTPAAASQAPVSASQAPVAAPQAPAAALQVPLRPRLPPTTLQTSFTQPLQQSTPTGVGDRLPQPLQHAVQQLSQQRSAVIQAVQSRAQRALHGRRSDEAVYDGNLFSSAESLVGSPAPQVNQNGASEGESAGGMWSVTRISEVLHRRIVAPMMGQGAQTAAPPSMSPTWQSPVAASSPPGQVLTPEDRRAMAAWTARPSILTTPTAPERPQNDDSSAASLSQELVMEEVRKQVQLAMQGRDSELQALKAQNEELQRALEASAQLLNDVVQSGGGGLGPRPQEVPHGTPGVELGGTPEGEGGGVRQVPRAPPGLEGPLEQPGEFPGGRGLSESVLRGEPGKLPGQAKAVGGIRDGPRGTAELGSLLPGPSDGSRVPQTDLGFEAEASPLDLLVQGMRQLQQVYMEKRGSPETEAMKGSQELPPLPDLLGETGVEFSDWLYVAEQTVGSLSDSAASWFEKTLTCSKEAYQRHQVATPMERLSIAPLLSLELKDHRWNRLERKVMTMLLNAMPRAVRDDAVTHRVATVAGALFRLHVLYAPGGVAERTTVLKQLEGAPGTDNIVDTIASLRRWRRNLTRALEMSLTPPDASVLLKGIEQIAGTAIRKNHDMSFRLQLARNELQLQHRPTQETVLKYYDHMLSELQQSIPARTSAKASGTGAEGQPHLRAVGGQAGTGEARSPSTSPTKAGGKQGTPCRFFASDARCRRGTGCKYAHDFLNKEEKRARCWHCGSRQHRQAECPIKDPNKAQKSALSATPARTTTSGPAPSSSSKVAMASAPEPKAVGTTTNSTTSTIASSTTSGEAVVTGEPIKPFTPEALQNPELQSFMKEVNTMLQRFSRLNRLSLVDDVEFNAKVKKMEVEMDVDGCSPSSWALLDSGATNPFRPAVEGEEQTAIPVQVQLADGKSVLLRQNRAGTLLPYSKKQATERGANTVIVPLGSLVQELGCAVNWTRRGLEVVHPAYGVISTHVSGACPFIGEARALELIGELEGRKLEQLKVATVTTQLRLQGMEAKTTYNVQLAEYRRTGNRNDGLKALMCEDSVFGCLTEAQRCALAQDVDLSDKAGHKYLKMLPVKRAMRKRLMSTQWLVHLFSGEGGSAEFKVFESDCVTLLEVDIGLSKAFNMREPSAVYKALLWAAMRGQLRGLVGAPPRGEGCGELVLKQMFLWNVAKLTAEEHEVSCPVFTMTMPKRSELWESAMWKKFRSFMDVAMNFGVPDVVVASNMVLKNPESEAWEKASPSGAIVWTAKFREALVRAIHYNDTMIALRRLHGPLSSMSKEELARWTMHVRNGHLPYSKRCKTCVAARATGHQHRRIEAPSCYVMSLDVAGPFRKKGQNPDGSDYRYMLVASYTMPVLEGRKCQPGDEIVNESDDGRGVGPVPAGDSIVPPGSVPEPAGDPVVPPGSVPEPTGDPVVPPGSVPEPAGDPVVPPGSVPAPAGDPVVPPGSVPEPAGDPVVPPGSVPEPAGDPVVPPGSVPEPAGDSADELDRVSSPPCLDDLFVEEEGEPVDALKPEEQEEWDRLNKEYNELVDEIGDTMNYQVLRFAVPMRSRRAPEVNARVRQVYLQIRAEGLPVLRCHSDRATELCNKRLRDWLLERGVLPTTGEAQTPQQNGRAEASVKFVKAMARTLLTAARLPAECWPLAMSYAVHKQRLEALGKGESLPSFGSPVHVRTKVYGRAGRYDVENKWRQGVYVGPSSDVQHGHCVRFPDGTFVTSLHLKDHLVDADALVDLVPREVELPVSERRVRGKSRLAALSMGHPLSHEELVAENAAKELLRSENYGIDAILSLFALLKMIKVKNARGRERREGVSWTTGMFVHGGVAGLRGNTQRMKWTTRFMVKAARRIVGDHQFTSLGLLENQRMGCHRDLHNDMDSENAVILLKEPESGGELWLETEGLSHAVAEWKQVSRKMWKKGMSCALEIGKPFFFNPRKWHEVQAWQGDRVTMVLYNPRSSNLHYKDKDTLEFMGFPMVDQKLLQVAMAKNDIENLGVAQNDIEHPGVAQGNDESFAARPDEAVFHADEPDHPQCQYDKPELFLIRPLETEDGGTLEDSLVTLTEEQDQLLEDLNERSNRLRWLLEEEQALLEECRCAGAEVTDEVENVTAAIEDMIQEVVERQQRCEGDVHERFLKAAQPQEEPDYEQMLEQMTGDLEVVHTVPLEQVRRALDKWMEALKKEVDQLLNGTLKPIPLWKAREMERRGELRIVPSKGVFTLKPPTVRGQRARRKFRLVLCGNFAVNDNPDFNLYAGGVSAETLRLALTFASVKKWRGATSDVTAAFLLADWPENLAAYAIHPPRILLDANLAKPDELWLVMKPLYGLRESPSIWSQHRTNRLSKARIPWKGRTITLKPSLADPDLWMAFDEQNHLKEQGELLALIITYVDDLFYLSEDSLVRAIHDWVQAEWPCSQLEWAHEAPGTRYLGMEVVQKPNFVFEICQEGYIKELLRNYDMSDSVGTKLPCPKEWLCEGEGSEDENYSTSELKAAQRIVGEHLWLTMRTRPDLQYPVMYMASRVSRQPNKVVQIGRRLLSYLKATQSMKLLMGAVCDESDENNSSSDKQQHEQGTVHTDIARIHTYSDASFSPFGEKSFGACVVMYLGSAIAWKSSKQGFVTLSVMEAELYETTNAVILLENIASILDEILGKKAERYLMVDNSSALAMIQGGQGSWRTRHLKVRSAKLRSMVEDGEIIPQHIVGEKQVADLATKMHPKMRLWELLLLWGFRHLPTEAVQALCAKGAYLAMLVLALAAVPSRADDATKTRVQSVGVDELLMVTVVVCIAAVACWEMLKWLSKTVVGWCRESPKQRKLRRLRETARAAAEEEIDKAFLDRVAEDPVSEPTIPPPPPVHDSQLVRRGRSTKRVIENQSPPPPIQEDVYERFPDNAFYKTNSSKSKLHTNSECPGLRNSGDVYRVEYCAYCQNRNPLYTRRSRSLQPSRSY